MSQDQIAGGFGYESVGGRQFENTDEAAARAAAATMVPVWPERTGVRTVVVEPLGRVTLEVLWSEDSTPPNSEDVKHWEIEARELHESRECTYWSCTVLAICGHMEGEDGLGEIQIAEDGGDDAERVERELAETAILDVLGLSTEE